MEPALQLTSPKSNVPVPSAGRFTGQAISGIVGSPLGNSIVSRLLGPSVSLRPIGNSPSRILVTSGADLQSAPSGSVVWGAGVDFGLGWSEPADVLTLDVRAARGPLTARTLIAAGVSVPEVFGDPILLLPRLLPEVQALTRVRRHSAVLVPHSADIAAWQTLPSSPDLTIVHPSAPLDHLLQTIAQSELVISGSILPIAVADALGIPARFIASSQVNPFDCRDYLAGTGRPHTRIATDVAEAQRLGGHTAPVVDLDCLSASFPHDLWDATGATQIPCQAPFAPDHRTQRAWERIVLRQPIETRAEAHEFEHATLPELAEALDTFLLSAESPNPSVESEDFTHAFILFHDAMRYRRDILPDLIPETLHDELRQLVRGLDSGRMEMLLRSRWLRGVGPHAVLRNLRSGPQSCVVSIALRPGSMSNNVRSIEARFTHTSGGKPVSALIPVFDTYQRQWSLDLTIAIGRESFSRAGSWMLDLILGQGDGNESALPVMTSPREVLDLGHFPRLDNPFSRFVLVIGDTTLTPGEPDDSRSQ